MKKSLLTIAAIALVALTFASCNKKVECTCKYYLLGVEVPGLTTTTTVNKSECIAETTTDVSGVTYTVKCTAE